MRFPSLSRVRPFAALALLMATLLATTLLATAVPAVGAPAYVDQAVAGLAASPLYVSPDAGTLPADPTALTTTLAASRNDVALVLLPAAAAQAGEGGDAATLPSLISSRVDRVATVLVVVGRQPYAASRTIDPGRLSAALASATPLLAPATLGRGAATAALQNLVGQVTGGTAGGVSDPQGPSRSGSPGGILVAIVLLGGGLLAAAVIALRIRRGRRGGPRRPPGRLATALRPLRAAPPPPRTRVEVDARGRVTKVTRPGADGG